VDSLPGGGGADGVNQLGDQRVLEQVAAGAGAQRVDVGIALVRGQGNQARAGVDGADRLDGAHAGEPRHAQVDQHEVRPVGLEECAGRSRGRGRPAGRPPASPSRPRSRRGRGRSSAALPSSARGEGWLRGYRDKLGDKQGELARRVAGRANVDVDVAK
jgi:hypothetical protein